MRDRGLGARILYTILQCTWGGIQTLAGLALFLWFAKAPHQCYHGAIHTKWNVDGGISLGLFIFTPDSEEEWCRQMAVHEYGHTWQSLILGPFYLIAVGIPSIIWCKCPGLIEIRKKKHLPYSAFYTERWADELGARMIRMEKAYGVKKGRFSHEST